MKQTTIEPVTGMVRSTRKIRDEINKEIMDMTFEEERAYLDMLLRAHKGNAEENTNLTHENQLR